MRMHSLAFSFGGKVRAKSATLKRLVRDKENEGKGRKSSSMKKGKGLTCGNEMRSRLVPMVGNEVIEPIKARLIKKQTDYALF